MIRVIIVFVLLVIILYLILDHPYFRIKRHFSIIERMDKLEKYYRALRRGEALPRNDFEKEIIAMREYDFERYIFRFYNAYEGGKLIAESRWGNYVCERKFERIVNSSHSPTDEETIRYWKKTPILEINEGRVGVGLE